MHSHTSPDSMDVIYAVSLQLGMLDFLRFVLMKRYFADQLHNLVLDLLYFIVLNLKIGCASINEEDENRWKLVGMDHETKFQLFHVSATNRPDGAFDARWC